MPDQPLGLAMTPARLQPWRVFPYHPSALRQDVVPASRRFIEALVFGRHLRAFGPHLCANVCEDVVPLYKPSSSPSFWRVRWGADWNSPQSAGVLTLEQLLGASMQFEFRRSDHSVEAPGATRLDVPSVIRVSSGTVCGILSSEPVRFGSSAQGTGRTLPSAADQLAPHAREAARLSPARLRPRRVYFGLTCSRSSAVMPLAPQASWT
jgi:hypothetical protein